MTDDDVGGHCRTHRCTRGGARQCRRSLGIEHSKGLVAGSGLQFADRGNQSLKGVPGEWHIYAVER